MLSGTQSMSKMASDVSGTENLMGHNKLSVGSIRHVSEATHKAVVSVKLHTNL